MSKTPRLFLHVLNTATPLACGALVPKRFAKRAVDRNALKRMFREACRHQTVYTQGRLLIRLVKPAGQVHPQNRADWWNEIEQLFNVQSKA
ncbi:ribonuclease P protein component [Limnobacter sp.]|uniref:ribonuclease P protein component n=1 Tax=Limnobacter TaxID=131079 RepID=UPI00338DE090